jgi:DNA-binding transcriptional regulator YhcF (GntR family)
MEFTDRQPIYIQIADYFCENILSRQWKESDKIPSVREIAVAMEVNPNTAMRSFTYLQDKEIIFNKRGIGYFVAEGGYEKALEMRKEAFITKELPTMFKTMILLNISCGEIEKLFSNYELENKKP